MTIPNRKKVAIRAVFLFSAFPQRVQGSVGGLCGPGPALRDGPALTLRDDSVTVWARRCEMMPEAATLRANACHSNQKPSLSARLGLVFVFVCASLVQLVNVCRAHLALC